MSTPTKPRNFIPSPQQLAVFDWVRNGHGSLNLISYAGTGKCLGRGTQVMMFSGEIKLVEEIRTGELLMGPDSCPRHVLSISTGYGPLWRITPIKGDSWVCNDAHVLTLAGTNQYKGQTIDAPLVDFLSSQSGNTSRPDKSWKLFRVSVKFEEKATPFHPYLIGVWLGDGTVGEPQFTFGHAKIPVMIEIGRIAEESGMVFNARDDEGQESFTVRLNAPGGSKASKDWQGTHHPLRQYIQKTLMVDGEKRIPQEYLMNSTETRTAVLSGILDTDAHQSSPSTFDIVTKYRGLRDDILFIARSLGFAAYASPKPVKLPGWTEYRIYWRISISGDASRLCTIRHKTGERKQVKDVLKTGWNAEPIGDGQYYGFTLDGDGRFLLGDFTVTHNTTTLMEIAKIIRGSAFCGAFNKAIADEFTERLKDQGSYHVKGATLHSAGMSAWLAACRPNRPQVDGGKNRKIARSVIAMCSWDKKLTAAVCEAVSYAKQQCLGVQGQPPYTEAKPWTDLIEYYDLRDEIPGSYPTDQFISMCQKVYKVSLEQCEQVIDFDDMLLAPLYFKAPFRKYEWVMIDEAQDTNTARRLVAYAMMHERTRMIAVGDPHQAIYGFAGANSDSMDIIKRDLNSAELPLSVTYRCPVEVVRVANTWVVDFAAHETAPLGKTGTIKHNDFFKLAQSGNLTPDDVILCRNTRPLVGLAGRLRDLDIPCVVEGASTRGLIALATKWGDNLDKDPFLDHLEEYQTKEVAALEAKGKEAKAEALADRCDILRDLFAYKSVRTTADLVRKIEFLFGDNQADALRLCTVHRSKGREWDRVFVIGMNRYMPSMWAKKDWELQQENNLCYVAVTRAKRELIQVAVPFKKKSGRDGCGIEWWEVEFPKSAGEETFPNFPEDGQSKLPQSAESEAEAEAEADFMRRYDQGHVDREELGVDSSNLPPFSPIPATEDEPF